ncbi:alginate export family protein [Foetidibacter luteolus]|uniref:alginate export family protein n=1 Tax=Foetidibacter luteolus TaxID=2608880 RepID=UPI00129A2C99|nr:alginate export family protein [Foetidibacter luteolus]
MKNTFIKISIYALGSIAATQQLKAQLTIGAQLRTRTEYRDGQGSPLSKETKPAIFTSQRTRVSLAYNMYRLKFGVTAQDVRVWGQDVSTINRTTTQDNNALMLHEAWAEILLTDTTLKNKALSLKIGRQELVYDDQRLIGNLDWLQQARRHDAAVLKYETPLLTLHAGAAFNQNKENASGTVYNSTVPGNYAATTNGGTMYKSMEFLYAARKLKKGIVSFLFFADQFSKFHNDTINSVPSKTFMPGTWGRATTGFYLNNSFSKLNVTASAYYQFGKTAAGQKLNAGLLSGLLKYSFNKKFSAGPGIDYTTGGSSGATSNTFDPLYGTPHKFWGLMDYFYAANGFGKGGLVDYYVKTKFKASDKFWLTADIHQFSSAAKVPAAGEDNKKKSFGTELDIVGQYSLTKQVSFEAGYSHFASTSLLSSANVKNIANAQGGNNWAYLMINVKL